MRWLRGGFLALVAIGHVGCATMQEPEWNKPWGKGALIGAAVCCPVGAGVGVWVQEERRGTASTNRPATGSTTHSRSEKDYWKGALIGCAIGVPLCGAIGHVFFDEPAVVEPPPVPEPIEGMMGETIGDTLPTQVRIVLRGVYFDFDRSEIRPDSEPVLQEAATILRANPDVSLVIVEGHTDSQGTDEYNRDLSLRRAEAVFRFLVNAGVAPEVLQTQGYGESAPVASNENEEGRAQNRRVELRVEQQSSVFPSQGMSGGGLQPPTGAPAAPMGAPPAMAP